MIEETETPLQVSRLIDVPGHSLFGEWAVPGYNQAFIQMRRLMQDLLPGRIPGMIQYNEICAKPADFFGVNDFQGPRFERANTAYPGIVVKHMPNPCNRPYRLIDGRRRLEKYRQAGFGRSRFYVLEFNEIKPYIRKFQLIESSDPRLANSGLTILPADKELTESQQAHA